MEVRHTYKYIYPPYAVLCFMAGGVLVSGPCGFVLQLWRDTPHHRLRSHGRLLCVRPQHLYVHIHTYTHSHSRRTRITALVLSGAQQKTTRTSHEHALSTQMRSQSKDTSTLALEIAIGSGSSIFLGFGVFFLMLWSTIWV
jgi:hypothetical protein